MTQKVVFAILFAVAVAVISSPASAAFIYDGSDFPTNANAATGNPTWNFNSDPGGSDPANYYSLLPSGCTAQVDCTILQQNVPGPPGQHFNNQAWPGGLLVSELDTTNGWSVEVRAGNVTAANTSGTGIGNGFLFYAVDAQFVGGAIAWRPNATTGLVDIQLTNTPSAVTTVDGGGNTVEVLGLPEDQFHTVRMERASAAAGGALTLTFHGPGSPEPPRPLQMLFPSLAAMRMTLVPPFLVPEPVRALASGILSTSTKHRRSAHRHHPRPTLHGRQVELGSGQTIQVGRVTRTAIPTVLITQRHSET